MIENFTRDFRHAARMLRRSPGFTLIAIMTLALGIGANTAIFSVVKAVLLDALPYNDAGRIVAVQTDWLKSGRTGSVSGGDYPDLIAEPSPFAAVSRYAGGELPVEVAGQAAEFVSTYSTDAGFTSVFQMQPIAGRLITPEEFKAKADVATVGEAFASRHFGEPKKAIGGVMHIEGRSIAIVGVLPVAFHYPLKSEIWWPLTFENTNRTAHNYRAVALLKPGVTVEGARAHMKTIGARLQQSFPATHADKSFTATPLKELLVERSRSTLWLLMGAVGLVLAIVCGNLANLLLARATSRSREIALRAALGAGRGRLIGQMLVESVLLALLGGLSGLALAYASLQAFVSLAPANLPRVTDIHIDSAVLVFNLLISIGSAAIFGLWPALRLASVDLNDSLKQGGSKGAVGAGRGDWVRAALVSAEVCLALVPTLGAGLLFRSLLALNAVDLGYQTEGRTVLTVSIPAKTEEEHVRAGATFERIFTQLRQLPGVSAVAGVMGLPSGPYGSNGAFAVEGVHVFGSGPVDKMPQAGFRLASPGYFGAMGVPLIDGRDFDERDLYEAEPVAIVSAALARHEFAGQNAIGRRLKCGLDRDVWMRVVGVAGDMRNENPNTPPASEIYMPYRQHPYFANDLHVVIRSQGEISTAAVRAVQAVDRGIPVKVSSLEQFNRDAVSLPRFRTMLLIVFAIVAAVIATAGVYGVMSYVAAQRQTEMGIRMALGATSGEIIGMLVRDGAKLTGIGLVAGLAIALLAGRAVQSMLYGIKPQDPLTVIGAVVLLSAAALLAALVPALRASRVDPLAALRQE